MEKLIAIKQPDELARLSFGAHEIRDCNVETLLEALNRKIEVLSLPFPYLCTNTEAALADFKKLKETDCVASTRAWTHVYSYDLPPTETLLGMQLVGMQASGFFNEKYRIALTGKGPSAKTVWNDVAKRLSAMKILRLQLQTNPRGFTMRKVGNAILQRSTYGAQFRPASAKALFQLFNARDIYDFSMGWGDRLVAALATPTVTSYTGCDPNLSLHSMYAEMVQLYADKSFKTTLISKAAEDIPPFSSGSFDLVFSSPPYYDCEKYAKGERHECDQSWYRYRTREDWLDKFLFAAIQTGWRALKPDGHLAVNIADVKDAKGQRLELCNALIRFVKDTFHDSQFVGCIGYMLNRRTNAQRPLNDGNAKYGEPVWVWKKKEPIHL